MCRSKDHGGRRCPSCSPERRSAYRRALKARRDAEAEIASTRTEQESEALVEPNTEAATGSSETGSSPASVYNSVYNAESFSGVKELLNEFRLDPDYRQEVVEAFGGEANFARHVGKVMADEAMARIDFDADEERIRYRDDIDVANEDYEAAFEEMDVINSRIDAITEQARAEAKADPHNPLYPTIDHRIMSNPEHKELLEASQKYLDMVNNLAPVVTGQTYPERTKRRLAELADSYRDVLSEVRTMGGSHAWSKESDKDAVMTFNSAIQDFPSEWIEASAYSNTPPPIVRISKERAHYTHEMILEKKEMVPQVTYVSSLDKIGTSPGLVLNRDDNEDPVTMEMFDENADMSSGDMSTWTKTAYSATVCATSTPMPGSFSDEDMERNKPKGRGWELHRYTDYSGSEKVCWRRPKKTSQVISRSVPLPQILTSTDHTEIIHGMTDADSTARHEFVHRSEYMVKGLSDVEREFLESRTSGESLSRIYKGKDEMGYKDHFVHHYMGKIYRDKDNYEIMSTGVEGLFCGRFGGFIGLSNDGIQDEDMRNFVLGVLASK